MSFALKEERVTISGAVSIGATVTYTDKNKLSPAIVVIMGTGKTDRDVKRKDFGQTYTRNLLNFLQGLDLYVSDMISGEHFSQQVITIPQDCMTLGMMQFP